MKAILEFNLPEDNEEFEKKQLRQKIDKSGLE